MYMTVLKMDKNSILTAEKPLDLTKTYDVHQWVTYQQDRKREEDKILYRVYNRENAMFLYIQTLTPFNIDGIDRYGLTFVRSFDVEELYRQTSGEIHFDVQCYPCVKRCGQKGRYFLNDRNERKQWLEKQLEKHGAELQSCLEYKIGTINANKNRQTPLYLPTVCFKGTLTITDEEKFLELILNGLGRLKTFGLGLVLFR